MLGCGDKNVVPGTTVATLNCVFPLLANLIYWLILFSGTVSLIVIIISGLRFITSGGEAKSVETAKKSMTYAILGLLLVFLAFLILNTIAYVTNVACLSDITKGIPSFQSCGSTTSSGSGGVACSSSNPGGSCPAGQTCGYDSSLSMQTCLYNCDYSHPHGYCPHGTCTYNSTSGIYTCQ